MIMFHTIIIYFLFSVFALLSALFISGLLCSNDIVLGEIDR